MGATAASLGTVLLKRGPRQDPFGANAVGCAIGAVISGAISLALGESHALPATMAAAWPVIYLTIAGSLGAYVIMSWLVSRWSVTRTSYVTVIVPVIALALGAPCATSALAPRPPSAPPWCSPACSSACAPSGRSPDSGLPVARRAEAR